MKKSILALALVFAGRLANADNTMEGMFAEFENSLVGFECSNGSESVYISFGKISGVYRLMGHANLQTDILQVACRLMSRLPETARWTSLFCP
ncbi:hypothetical protein, partial [Ruegeria sp. PrR005]|uniref:hypothetical protein n=1 Tax=Ruegeria sp. PrR005 TaxID=2706882 RepID=UPI0019444E3A